LRSLQRERRHQREGRGVGVIVVSLLVAAAAGCGPKEPEGPPIGVSSKEGTATLPAAPTTYAFDPLDDDRPVSSEVHRGKPVVMAFITTGDIICQAQVGFLNAMAKNDGDRVAYAVVAIHPRREIVLVEAYRKSLEIEFPLALADASATAPGGPFGEIPAVPTVLVLDRFGKVVWKHTGLAKVEEIRAHVRLL
jgi:hypothetical protein